MADSAFASGFRTGFGSAFFAFLFERFASFGSISWKEINAIWGVEDELRKLHRTFLKIQDLLDYMEGNPLRFSSDGTSNGWQIWFEELRKLAYDTDTLLDHISLHLSSYCMEHSVTFNQERQVLPMVFSSFSRLNVPHDILEIQKKLDVLVKEMESLDMIEKLKCNASKISPSSSSQFIDFCSRASYVHNESVVGRIRDKECIVDLLGQKNEKGNFSVIPIVGMGGIGKTTLARLVYNDKTVCTCFQRRIWVSISVDFDAVRIMKAIIECATLCACNLSDLNSLQVALQKILFGGKFLLVLDDYWTENHGDWDILSSPFRFGSKGSKIIVTTRSLKVSSIVSSLEAYKLDILSEDDCWEVIKQRALPNLEAIQNFESIGTQIAKKCKGLPLVATTLGSLLRCKSTEEEWHSILENELWDMQGDKHIFYPLMLSYLHLPPHLKKCFAYCSIFPQNHEYEVDELVLLWMADGFIQPVGARRLEDLGSDYFNDLYLRSFFHECKNGLNQTVYKMHDLIHDMARVVSKDVCSHFKHTMPDCYPLFVDSCHLSLIHDGIQTLKLKASQKNERLRTFLVMSTDTNAETRGEVDSDLFSNCKSLRVLDLSGLNLTELSDSFDELEYLRYLNLSGNRICYLPKDICKLMALQTLKLKNCFWLIALPDDMKNLSNLRHLELDVVRSNLKFMPIEFGRLTGLQTLSIYVIGIRKGHRMEELKNMNSLRGALCIKNIEYVSDPTDAVEAKLEMKTCLDKLELQWRKLMDGLSILDQRRSEQAEVLANLRPHENLKELVIKNYCGIICPDWLSEPWRKFTSIQLRGLKYCDKLPSLGQLPFLKHFVISDLPCLESVDNEFYGTGNSVNFPSLESFELSEMSVLVHWRNESISAMPCLTAFKISNCPHLISLPPKLHSVLGNSRISNCPNLQLLR